MKQQVLQWLRTLHNHTMHGVCSGVSESHNEVASRIRFLAKFRRPKTAVLGVFASLLLGVAIFCLGGNNPIITAGASNSPIATPTASTQPVATATATPTATATAQPTATKTPIETTYTTWQADLLHDGDDKTETIIWNETAWEDSRNEPLYAKTTDTTDFSLDGALWQLDESQSLSTSHAGNVSYSLYSDETGDYILRYSELWYGTGYASFELFYLSQTGEEIVVASDEVEILTDGMPVTDSMNDIPRIISFFETITEYTKHSYVLVSTLSTVHYYDAQNDTVLPYASFTQSSAETPLQVIPSLMLNNFTPTDVEIPDDSNASETLQAQLEALNEIRANNYAERLAEEGEGTTTTLQSSPQATPQAPNVQSFGMVYPFTETPTYATLVAESAQKYPDRTEGVSISMQTERGTTVMDRTGNEVRYSLGVTNGNNTTDNTYNSYLWLNQIYWDGMYQGDDPDALDRTFTDFYYYESFQSMLESAHELPQGSDLTLTVDGSASDNHKKPRMIAYTCYSKIGTVLDTGSIFYRETGIDNVISLEIPNLDYHDESEMVIQFHVIFNDETTDIPEDWIIFALSCKK